jgi:hypothetical protein
VEEKDVQIPVNVEHIIGLYFNFSQFLRGECTSRDIGVIFVGPGRPWAILGDGKTRRSNIPIGVSVTVVVTK